MGDDLIPYQFRVSGHLGPTLLMAFPALAPRQQGAETVLTGLLPDAAALYGVLAEIEALGLDLLEVRKLRPRARESPGSGDDCLPAWRRAWACREGWHGRRGRARDSRETP